MAYDVTKTNGDRLALVEDRQLDQTTTLRLLGRNYPGYGEVMAENLVQLLEHFANDTEPANPLDGQLWWKTSEQVAYVFTETEWIPVWGPGNASGTGIDLSQIIDDQGDFHHAIKFRVHGIVVCIVSSDTTEYTPGDAALASAFPTIGPGLNLNYSSQYGTYKLRGRSLEAEFADLAEIYHSDVALAPGEVVTIGGEFEITKNTQARSTEVFGVISTAPGLLLNTADKQKDLHYPVALSGKVPCLVDGPIAKGQRLVAGSIPGTAQLAPADASPFEIIGRSLESKNSSDVSKVMIVVGAK